MKDQRQKKLEELKNNLETANKELLELNYKLKELRAKAPGEQKEEEVKEAQTALVKMIAVMSAMEEEYKNTKLNKLSSSFFEWMPSPPNRRTKRAMAKQRQRL
jgi:DNA repair ATPase RecN